MRGDKMIDFAEVLRNINQRFSVKIWVTHGQDFAGYIYGVGEDYVRIGQKKGFWNIIIPLDKIECVQLYERD